MFVRLCGWRLKTLCWWWMTATSACSHATSVSWHDHYFHNPLSCFDTSLSFRIVVVLLGDPCLPFVLQLFTKQHFIALFSNLSCSTSFSILLSFRCCPQEKWTHEQTSLLACHQAQREPLRSQKPVHTLTSLANKIWCKVIGGQKIICFCLYCFFQ